MFGGLAEFSDTFYLANSYKLAGDRLIDTALRNEEAWDLFCPAVYNYRHATELYLKSISANTNQTHNLMTLFKRFEKFIDVKYNETCPDWLRNTVFTFNSFDPFGTTFRYGGKVSSDEVFIDFIQMKTLMGWMAKLFQNIHKLQDLSEV